MISIYIKPDVVVNHNVTYMYSQHEILCDEMLRAS